MEFLANLIANLGESLAETNSKGCFLAFIDEPECPESLIK